MAPPYWAPVYWANITYSLTYLVPCEKSLKYDSESSASCTPRSLATTALGGSGARLSEGRGWRNT